MNPEVRLLIAKVDVAGSTPVSRPSSSPKTGKEVTFRRGPPKAPGLSLRRGRASVSVAVPKTRDIAERGRRSETQTAICTRKEMASRSQLRVTFAASACSGSIR